MYTNDYKHRLDGESQETFESCMGEKPRKELKKVGLAHNRKIMRLATTDATIATSKKTTTTTTDDDDYHHLFVNKPDCDLHSSQQLLRWTTTCLSALKVYTDSVLRKDRQAGPHCYPDLRTGR